MEDPYKHTLKTIDSVIEDAFNITPDDTNLLPKATRSLYVGEGGDLDVVMVSDAQVTLTNVPSGTLLPIRIKKVLTSTTADGLVGLL